MPSIESIDRLISVHLLENQLHNNLFMKLTYPSISDTLRSYIEKHCALFDDTFDTNSGNY
jgi:hypothetical protein